MDSPDFKEEMTLSKLTTFYCKPPGITDRDTLKANPTIAKWIERLNNAGFKEDFEFAETLAGFYTVIIDSIPGSFCLNQDWLTFSSPAEIEWGWVKPLALAEYWEEFYADVAEGRMDVIINSHAKD